MLKERGLHGVKLVVSDRSATRRERAINRKIKHAHFPVIKTIDEYDWSAPDSINQELVRFLFNLDFIEKKENVALIGPPGTGKTHLMTSLAFHACKCGHSVLFAQAIDIINTLDEAQKNGTYSDAMKSFVSPEILCVDEIGSASPFLRTVTNNQPIQMCA